MFVVGWNGSDVDWVRFVKDEDVAFASTIFPLKANGSVEYPNWTQTRPIIFMMTIAANTDIIQRFRINLTNKRMKNDWIEIGFEMFH